MTQIAITLTAPKNWPEIRDVLDANTLTTKEALWVARQILAAATSTIESDMRESFLRAYMVGVLQDVAEHEARADAPDS